MAVRPVRPLREKRGWAFNIAVPILKPTLLATTKHTWIDGEKIPATGGCILVLNHVSHIDPLTAAHIVYDHGRKPRYLAKSGLFKNKVLGYFLRGAGQIPVERLSKNAKGAFDAAVAAVEAGECVVVYPEGTLTRDPDLWPMQGKTGAARIALETGCPVVPMGQWGAHDLLYPYAKRPHLVPAHPDHDEGGRPGAPRRPARKAEQQRRDQRGDPADHGRPHRLGRRPAPRGAAGRAVRPAQGRACAQTGDPRKSS